jgi:hypothetical protein
VVHITTGYSRAYRPDLNQLMLELIVEPQARSPILRNRTVAPTVIPKRLAR